jgi:hypothetical protein
MTENDPYHPAALVVPRSCVTEQVGNDVVTLDEARLHYHTMHEQVFQVLRASDGTRSVEEISALVFGQAAEPHLHLTGQALLDLMDAELIAEDAGARERFFGRRAFGKAAAALLLGGVGLPLVQSITAPDAASAVSRCGPWDYEQSCDKNPGNGCLSCCCCGANGAGAGLCRPEGECTNLGGFCI